jgi:hypothetical protein
METFGICSSTDNDLGSGARSNSVAMRTVSDGFSQGILFGVVLNWEKLVVTYRRDILRKGGFPELRDI